MSTAAPPLVSNHLKPYPRGLRMAAADEQQLITRAREGSREAFRLLVERYMKQAYNVAYGFLNNHQGAEEVAQDAFVRVFRSLDTFRGEAEFSTWLHRIVVNLSLNRIRHMRRKKERVIAMTDTDTPVADAVPEMAEIDLAGHIERALHELPTLQRAAVILRHVDGLSTKQVSAILRCSEGTVKTHLFRGLEKMKKRLQYLNEETA